MTHPQESRVSNTQDNFRLSESRSSVSALISRLKSSALGVDTTENDKSRGNSAKSKHKKTEDPFPWMPGFCSLCHASVGSRNAKHLVNLMNVYLENVTPNVKDCYSKPKCAAKLKKCMNDTLIFFHLFYQDVKEALEHSFYLEKMTALVSMFMDMEIKASLWGKESLKKLASRLTSSLYIFLDNSEEHMLDTILMTKFVHKNYREIFHPLLRKLLNNISTYPMYDLLYVRCLLTFKLWKKIVPDAEERKRINKTAIQKLHAPPNLTENIKAMGNVLPRIPKTKKNITLFLMQSNFNVKNACQEFLKSVKKSKKSEYSQGLGNLEIDEPLFFINNSGDTSPMLIEKEADFDSCCSNNLINDIWSGISVVESTVPQTKSSMELNADKIVAVDSPCKPEKKKKLDKKVKKGKKKAVVSSGVKSKKKKKSIKNSETTATEKEDKKWSKLKGKKKKLCQSDECNIIQVIPQVDEIKLDYGDLLPHQAAVDNIFAAGNRDLGIEMLSESCVESVEDICQENMGVSDNDNLIKSAGLGVSSEWFPDASNMRYYNSSGYQKCSETVSSEKESFSAQSSYSSKIGDCRIDNAHVVVETMDHSLVNCSSSSRLTSTTSTPETLSQTIVDGAGMQQSPLSRKETSGKLLPEHTVDSQNTSGKQGAGEFSMAQSRASIYISNYEPTIVSSSVPTGQYMPDSLLSASQNSNIPTNSYPSINTAVGTTQGTVLPPNADLWRCNCADCSVGSVNFSTVSSGETNYSYYQKIPTTYETPNDWKSPNDRLLEKIEESLNTTTYVLNSNTSLPLKKRLKEANLTNNDFYKNWNNYYETNKTRKSVIVDNRAGSSTTNLKSSTDLNNQSQTNMSTPSSKSAEANDFKSNQSNSKESPNRKIDVVEKRDISYSEKASPSVSGGKSYLQRCEDKSLPHHSGRSRHCGIEKSVPENDEDDDDDDEGG